MCLEQVEWPHVSSAIGVFFWLGARTKKPKWEFGPSNKADSVLFISTSIFFSFILGTSLI